MVLALSVCHRHLAATTMFFLELVGLLALCHAAAMASPRVATWNIAGARREGTDQVDLDAVVGRPRLLVDDLNMPSTVLLQASRRGWPERGAAVPFPNSTPTQQLKHILRNDPVWAAPAPRRQVAAAPVSDHRALAVELDIATS